MGTAGQTPRSCPYSLAVAPAPYLEPPCWSEPCCPPRRAGGTTVSSPPPSLGAKPSLPEVTLGGNRRVRPLRKGKYPDEGPPQQAATPNHVCVCWGSGSTVSEAKQAGRPEFHSGASGRCLQQLPQPHCRPHRGKHIWNRACEPRREGGPTTTTSTTKTLATSIWGVGLSQRETLHLALDTRHLLKQSLFAPFSRRED